MWQVGEHNGSGLGVNQVEPVGWGKGLKQIQSMKGAIRGLSALA